MERAGTGAFAKAAAAQLVAPQWRGIGALLFVILVFTVQLMARHDPLDTAYNSGLGVQAIALVSISVALLRAATTSKRKRWSGDAAFFLFLLLYLIEWALSTAAVSLGGGDIVRLLPAFVVALLLFAPLSVWQVAAAVDVPLAWRPSRWLQNLGSWLPPLALLLVPLAVIATAQAILADRVIAAVGTGAFWPLVIADSALWTLLVMAALALRVTAYRHVAPA